MTTKRVSAALAKLGGAHVDVVVAFRLHRVDERFEVEWDAATWTDDEVGGSGLPRGVAQAIAQEMLETAAADAVGRKASTVGVAWGKAAIQSIVEHLGGSELVDSVDETVGEPVAGRRS